MARHTIEPIKIVNYVRELPNEALDGLYFACQETMGRLGIARENGSADSIERPEKHEKPTGNMKSVIDSVLGLETPNTNSNTLSEYQRLSMNEQFAADKHTVAVIFDAVRSKMRAKKHDPKPGETDDTVAARKAKETKAQKRANKASRDAAHAEEKAKAKAAEDRDAKRVADAESQKEKEAAADKEADAANKARAKKDAARKARRAELKRLKRVAENLPHESSEKKEAEAAVLAAAKSADEADAAEDAADKKARDKAKNKNRRVIDAAKTTGGGGRQRRRRG